jgi:hypothetical protein
VHTPHLQCSTKNYINNTPCLDITAYSQPVGIAFGNLSRNAVHGPGFNYDNLSIFKNFPIYERVIFQFRAEAFNVTNHTNIANPGTTNGNSSANSQAYSLGQTSSPGFGLVTDVQKLPGQLTGSRVLQLSGKINF